ncbi:hypothetical protein ANO11243_080990 [Dothideomycetidae sp. 11243]|nr:hypothetical protein ANO11243_080990 [fungal sp. No.11243]
MTAGVREPAYGETPFSLMPTNTHRFKFTKAQPDVFTNSWNLCSCLSLATSVVSLPEIRFRCETNAPATKLNGLPCYKSLSWRLNGYSQDEATHMFDMVCKPESRYTVSVEDGVVMISPKGDPVASKDAEGLLERFEKEVTYQINKKIRKERTEEAPLCKASLRAMDSLKISSTCRIVKWLLSQPPTYNIENAHRVSFDKKGRMYCTPEGYSTPSSSESSSGDSAEMIAARYGSGASKAVVCYNPTKFSPKDLPPWNH